MQGCRHHIICWRFPEQNYYTERVDQARAEGLRNVTAALGITAAGHKVSVSVSMSVWPADVAGGRRMERADA